MQLVPNWRAVIRRAWSIRLALISAVLSGLEALVWLAPDALNVEPGRLALIAFFASAAAGIARVVAQNGVTKNE